VTVVSRVLRRDSSAIRRTGVSTTAPASASIGHVRRQVQPGIPRRAGHRAGPLVHVQDLQGVDVLDPAGTLSKQRLAVPDHIEAERDALAQGIGEGPERSDEQHL
jgi:hypothetical protein